MTKGQKAILNCPPDMAFGEDYEHENIPAGSTIRFEIELMDIIIKGNLWKLIQFDFYKIKFNMQIDLVLFLKTMNCLIL